MNRESTRKNANPTARVGVSVRLVIHARLSHETHLQSGALRSSFQRALFLLGAQRFAPSVITS